MVTPFQLELSVERLISATLLAGGSVFYVSNNTAAFPNAVATTETVQQANRAGGGRSPSTPFNSIDYAVGQCTASRGDLIVVLPGHAETVVAANGLDIDVAGIKIVGIGQGALKPAVNLGTLTTATVRINAANIYIGGISFVSAIDDLAVIINATKNSLTMEDCDFTSAATFEFLCAVSITTTMDNFVFRRCKWMQAADPTGTDGAAATGAIYCVDTENVLVEDCAFIGFFETACLHNKTTAMKNLTWRRNTVSQQLTITGRRILLVAGTSGMSIGTDTDFVPGLGYKIQKVEDVSTATKDALFTVAGKVLIGLWESEVTTVLVGAGPTDYVLGIDGGSVMMASSDIHAAAAGYMFQVTGDPADTALTAGTNGGLAAVKASDCDTSGLANRVVGLAGLATLSLAATRTAATSGNITHDIWFIPLEPGAHVVAAA